MKYEIKDSKTALEINVKVPLAQQAKLLEEFNKCATGSCSCPSPQYDKLAGIEVEQSDEGVNVTLTAKADEVIDKADIQRCLEHTAHQIQKS